MAEEMTAARERYINGFLTDILFRKLLLKKPATKRRPGKDFKKINIYLVITFNLLCEVFLAKTTRNTREPENVLCKITTIRSYFHIL